MLKTQETDRIFIWFLTVSAQFQIIIKICKSNYTVLCQNSNFFNANKIIEKHCLPFTDMPARSVDGTC